MSACSDPRDTGWMEALSRAEAAHLRRDWRWTARPDQIAPDGAPVWLVLGGRGSGKTRSGAEWVLERVRAGARRIALVGPTLHAVREVMLGGDSGLLSVGYRDERPDYQPTRRRLVFPNGAEAWLFSAFEPDSLRGPQFDTAWGDELCAWADPAAALANLRMGLRLGRDPRLCLTTTPRPIPLLDTLMAEDGCHVTRSRTADNARHLAPGFVARITRDYGGSALGRQELDGEIVRDHPGSVFQRAHIDETRVDAAPRLDRVLVCVDPPATSGKGADACGLVVVGSAGEGMDARGYVLFDATLERAAPEDWALRAVALAQQYGAEAVLAETNQGGEMVEAVIAQIDPDLPVLTRHATTSKRHRAVPVGLLYARGRVSHVGRFDALEDEMCAFGTPGRRGSPDRMDALVWGLRELLLESGARPRVRFL